MNTRTKTLFLTQFSILLAIEAVFCFTPLGSLPAFGPIVATLGMVPVVITALSMGTGAGTLMGFFAGLFSFIVWTFMPPMPIMAFVFTPFYSFGEVQGNFGSLLICFVPRILVGTVAGLCHTAFKKAQPKSPVLYYGLAGALGSFTNTLLVMGGIALFFGDAYSSLAGSAMIYIIGITILTSGIPEAIIAGFAGYAVCKPLNKALNRRR